jgi:hypothetical protein
VASAEKALPALTEINAKLDGMRDLMDKLPADGKAKVTEVIKANLGKLEDQFAKLMWIPGVADQIKPVVNQVLGKMASLGGLPAPQFPQLSGDLAGMVSSLTETLTGIKDSASAEAALPKLQDIDSKLDAAKSTMERMSDTAQATIGSLVKAALANLRGVVDRVIAIPGVGDKVKPVVEAIMGKLTNLAG